MNKRIFKSIPVAFALLVLASCSNEDFLGSNKDSLSGKKQLIATVEDPTGSDDAMRAAFSWNAGAKNTDVLWQKGDVFRVYDAALQVYDEFKCDGEAIVLDGDADVNAYAKAIFPGDQVYYAGWSKDAKAAVAVVGIPSTVTYGGAAVESGKIAYVSNLPLWGDAEVGENDNLIVKLAHLGAYAEITAYKGAKYNKVRVVAAKDDQVDLTEVDTPVLVADAGDKVDLKTPLAGYFEAQLVQDGILTANLEGEMTKDSYSSVIEVELTEANEVAGEAHVFIPIVPATYKYLVFQKYNTTESKWETMNAYKNQAVKRNTHIASKLTIGTAPKQAKVTSLADLNKKLKEARSSASPKTDVDFLEDGDVVDVEIAAGSELATIQDDDKAKQTLVLPDDISLTINIKGAIKNAIPNEPLRISGGAGQSHILNIEGGIEGSNKIVVEVENTCDLTLAGEFKSTGTYGNIISLDKAKSVTFGNGDIAPFITAMDVKVGASAGNVTVNAGTGSLGKIDLTAAGSNNSITVESGSVAAIGSATAAAGAVTVNGGAVASIKTTSGAITVGKAGADVEVTNVESATGAITITEATVANVTRTDKTGAITLNGGKTATANIAEITTLKVAKDKDVTVTSNDKAAIVNLDVTGGVSNKVTFVTTLSSGVKAADVKTTRIADGQIYTAAQLAGIGSGAYTLNAETVTLSGSKWTSVNLSGNFALAVGSTITGLDVPLFNTVSGTATIGTAKDKVLTLASSNIETDKADQGALAQVVSGTATIQYVTVDNAIIKGKTSNNKTAKNYGGLVGRVTGSLNLKDNLVKGTTAITAYANAGGFVGNFAGDTFTLTETDALGTNKNAVTFSFTDEPSIVPPAVTNTDAGTFGAFIGSITKANATILINQYVKSTTEKYGTSFNDYFTTQPVEPTALKFENNIELANGVPTGKVFKGMDNHEIGYSPVAALKKFILYVEEDTQLGQEFTLYITDINKWGE